MGNKKRQLNKNEKPKKIFLDDLPKWGKKGHGKEGTINWSKCIGYKVSFVYEDIEGYIDIIDYKREGKKTYLKIKYKDREKYIFSENLSKCKLGTLLNKVTSEFKVEIGKEFKDKKRNLIIINREYRIIKDITYKYYRYSCYNCGTKLWVSESNLLKGIGCGCCSSKTIVKGINDIATTNPELIKYFVNIEDAYKYTHSSGKTVLMKCSECGEKKEMIISDLYYKGFSCPRCSDGISYPNKLMFSLLKQLNINFETEYSPQWANKYRYDFYIPSINLIIEMDGGFHYTDNKLSGQTKEEDKLAIGQELNVIRIDCNYNNSDAFIYIKNNILNSELNKIFNFSGIDWKECEKESTKSLLLKACKLWNSGIRSTISIGIELSLHYATISKWLKIGTKIGMCDYDTKKTIKEGYKQGIKKTSKKVICINYKTIYSSLSKCKEELKLLGVRTCKESISKVCNNEKTDIKGLKFKFVDNLTEEEYIKYDIENKLKELQEVS